MDEEVLTQGGGTAAGPTLTLSAAGLGQPAALTDGISDQLTGNAHSLKPGFVYTLEPYEIGLITLDKPAPASVVAILSWPVEGVYGADYHLYRGCIANLNGTDYGVKALEVFSTDCPPAPVCPPDPDYCCCTPQPCLQDPDDPNPADLGYFYLITGRSDAGRDGVLGFQSTQVRTKGGTPCP